MGAYGGLLPRDGVGRLAHTGAEREQKLARGPVGVMNDELPAMAGGFRADAVAMKRDAADIILAPHLRAADGDRARAFGLEKFDAPGIGERLFGGIDDLHDVSHRAVRGHGGDRAGDLRSRAPEIAEKTNLVARPRNEWRRQAFGAARFVQDRLRHAVDHGAVRSRTHDAGNADAFAAAHEQFTEREGEHERAIELPFQSVLGRKIHRWRAIRPDPDRVRRFPFALAHIEMVVARRTAPVDTLRGLAGMKAAVLPEILAGTGTAAAVQAVKDGSRDAPRFQHEPRHRRDQP